MSGRGVICAGMTGCKRPCFQKKENLKTKTKNFRRKNLKSVKDSNFVSCVMVYDVVRFDLRRFLGFLAGFYVLCGKLSRLHRENGLEWLKMCFCYTGIRILMLLRYSKRGCCWNYARVQVCVYVYMYNL